jgi:hypothetical protein
MAKRKSLPADFDQLVQRFAKRLRPEQRQLLIQIIQTAMKMEGERLIGTVQPAISETVRILQRTQAENAELRKQPKFHRKDAEARKAEILKMSSEGKQAKEITKIIRRYWPGTSAEAVRQIISRAKPL